MVLRRFLCFHFNQFHHPIVSLPELVGNLQQSVGREECEICDSLVSINIFPCRKIVFISASGAYKTIRGFGILYPLPHPFSISDRAVAESASLSSSIRADWLSIDVILQSPVLSFYTHITLAKQPTRKINTCTATAAALI